MSDIPIVSGIILAAGLSRRFGAENKLLAPWRGRPLASYAIEAAMNSAIQDVVLVTGQDGDAVADLATAAKFHRVHNPNFADGLSSSLRAGLAAAPQGPVMVLLADMPMVTPPLIASLLGAWREGAYALVPEYQGQGGNPVILGDAARADAMALTDDRGARGLFKGRTDVIRHPVLDKATLRDFDSSEDFAV